MTAAQAQQDEDACVNVAARATVERAWAYIGCMVSKGHTVGVVFHVRAEPTYIGVTQTRPHDSSTVAVEVDECRKAAYAAGRAEGGSRDAMVARMESTFKACLEPRGYVIQQLATPGSTTSRR